MGGCKLQHWTLRPFGRGGGVGTIFVRGMRTFLLIDVAVGTGYRGRTRKPVIRGYSALHQVHSIDENDMKREDHPNKAGSIVMRTSS